MTNIVIEKRTNKVVRGSSRQALNYGNEVLRLNESLAWAFQTLQGVKDQRGDGLEQTWAELQDWIQRYNEFYVNNFVAP